MYCDFYSVAQTGKTDDFINAVMQEALAKKNFFEENHITTIYFGGGSPGILTASQIKQMMSFLGQIFNLTDIVEVTMELNPEDASAEFLSSILQAGVNRLSIGVQSTHDRYLQFLGRRHTADQAIMALKNARDVGFKNISADIIFGIPELSLSELSDSLGKITQSGIEHISAYLLTAEGKTLLTRRIGEGRILMPDDEECIQQFLLICENLKQAGFEHYEISNFGRYGYRSMHNSSYWDGSAYLGLGPAAHSYDGKYRRYVNVAELKSYIENITSGVIGYTEELLSETDVVNEYIMTHLRTSDGLNTDDFGLRFGKTRLTKLVKSSLAKIEINQLKKNGITLFIPENQMLISDAVISDLFQ